MSEFVRIANKSELPPSGQAKEFACGSKTICVANVNGSITAMDNSCMHRGGPLGQGTLDGDKIVCPWHGWQWNTQTGEAAHSAAFKLAIYKVKVEGDDVMVEV